VADMNGAPRGPGLTEQLGLVAWLRWRGLRNGLRNKNRRLDLLGVVFSILFSSLLVIGVMIALFVGTAYLFERHQERYFGLIFLALLVWWQLFPIMLAGFAPQFSFRSLLRFPLSFSAFYLIGLAYGLADAAAVASLIWLASMLAATAVAQPSALPAMFVACLLFAALNVTAERLLGAWLEKLLSKRRAREAVFAVFILSIVSLQFLNPLFERHGQEVEKLLERSLPYLWPLPSSFAGDFVASVSQGEWTAGALRLAGLLGYVVIFSALLWWRYTKLYAGEELSEGLAPAARKERRIRENVDDSESLGFLPPQILAVFRKELRYLERNTFLCFGLAIPPLMVFVFTLRFAGVHPGAFKGLSPDMFFPGMMAYLLLILIAPSYNSFAHEGRGIQTYFTSPVRFREVLLAKNLLTVLIVLAEMTLCVALVGARVGWPAPPVLFATLLAMIFSVVGQLTIANWTSISFPKKMEFGKMQGQRNSGMSVFLMFGAQLVLGAISTLILFSGRWTGNSWLPAEVFALLAAVACVGYFSSLDALTELAEAKKEVLIDALCR